ncbi:MAG: hypothetical protein LBT59_27730 [Clostridiales bacterium]|jgi:hypothetical protein|nr:hypothetical protein [Clostridiales bacterium]
MTKSACGYNRLGEIVFAGEDSRKASYKADSFFSTVPFQLFILILCASTDFASFNQMFVILLYDSQAMRWLAIVGMLVAFEIIPVVAANNLRKRESGYNSSITLTVMLIIIFLCGTAMNIYLRFSTRDTVFPNLSENATSMFGSGELAVSAANPSALPLSLFFGVLPLFTSVVSFACAYILFNPLQTDKRNLEACYSAQLDKVSELSANMQEYDSVENYREVMIERDDKQYEAMKQRLEAQNSCLKNYVSQKLLEYTTGV